MRHKIIFVVFSFLCVLYLTGISGNNKDSQSSGKTLTLDDITEMDINRVFLPLENNGSTGDAGHGYYPNGTILNFLYSGGLATTGFINGELRASWMAPASLIEEWQPGIWGMNPEDPIAQFYEVSVDDDFGSPAYLDWTDAVILGADFIDLNGDGVYDPYVDRPALLGDKTIWTPFNDGTPLSQRTPRLQTPPMGLQIQQTVWAYNRGGPLNDVIFFRFQIANVDSGNVDSLIFSIWVDPDLGENTDDLVGCDTVVNIGYIYNDGPDLLYGSNPPAFGIKMVQGVVVDSPGDTAFVFRGAFRGVDTLLDKRNLPWTSFMYYINGDPALGDPTDAQNARYYQTGGLDWYGNPIDPTQWGTGGTSSTNPNFFYSGDPVLGLGWIDDDPRDKRFLINNGPFNLALGDTQDIVIAYVVGQGTDPLNSITSLQQRASYLDEFFPRGRLLDIVVNDTLISIDSTFAFKAALFNLAFRDTILFANWSLAEKPIGSSAQIIPGSGFSAILDPDLPGEYQVQLEAIISGNTAKLDSITVFAVDNHPPAAQLNITPEMIVFGSTATADASASYDPDADALIYHWTLPNWVSALYPDTGIVHITPLHTGIGDVTVTVKDPYFMHSATENFNVIPDSNDVKSLFHSNDLADVEQMQLVNNKIYAIQSSGSEFYIFDARITPGQIDVYQLGGIHFSTNGSLLAIGGSQAVSLYILNSNFPPIYAADIPENLIQNAVIFSDMYFQSTKLFIPAKPRELRVYNVSDPANPTLASSHELPPLTRDVAFEDNIAAVFSQYPTIGLVTIDLNTLSPLDSLSLLGQFFGNVEYGGNNIYLLNAARGGSTVQIIDAVQPDNLQLAGVINVAPVLPGMGFNDPILEMEAFANRLLLGLKDGIQLYDVSDPYNPRLIAEHRSGLPVLGMAWDEPNIYMAKRGDVEFGAGYYMLGYDSTITGIKNEPQSEAMPKGFELLQNYPNPFNPVTTIRFGLPKKAPVRLEIFNVLGQRVRTLIGANGESIITAGWHDVQWDGRSETGNQVSSGLYFYRLTTDGYVQTRKLLLLR